MIKYALKCDKGHSFESWFQNSAAYDDQVKRKLVSCLICGSDNIEKRIMAPAISGTSDNSLISDDERKKWALLRSFREHVEKNCENVGKNFAQEARKIHNGESDKRTIYGAATPLEAKALKEEGVPVLPIPILPEEKN